MSRRRYHFIAALLLLVILIIPSCTKDLSLIGTWMSDPVSFTDSYGEEYKEERIILSFTEGGLTIQKGGFVSEKHPYSFHEGSLWILDPLDKDLGKDGMARYPLETGRSSKIFHADFSALPFLAGIGDTRYCKTSEELSLVPSGENPQHKHEWERLDGKDPSCLESGRRLSWKCEGCGRVSYDASSGEYIPESDTVIPALGHEMDYTVIKEPSTCNVSSRQGRGIRMGTCLRCGYFGGEEDFYLSHVMTGIPVPAVMPSCEKPGYEAHYVCIQCGGMFLTPDAEGAWQNMALQIEPLGHDWIYETGEEGYVHYARCSREGCRFADNPIPENHVYSHDMRHCAFCGAEESYQAMVPDVSIDHGKEMVYSLYGPLPENLVLPEKNASTPRSGDDPSLAEIYVLHGIKADAIRDGSNVRAVWIPRSYTMIERGVFSSCPELTDIYFEGTADEWGSILVPGEDILSETGNKTLFHKAGDRNEHIPFRIHTGISRDEFYSSVRFGSGR